MRRAVVVMLTFASFAFGEGKGTVGVFLDAGWGFGIGGTNNYVVLNPLGIPVAYTFSSTRIDDQGDLVEKTDHYVNYGSGLRLNAGVNYRLVDNATARLAVSYIAGVPKLDVETSNESNNTRSTTTYARNVFGFELMVLPEFSFLDLLTVYAGVGPGLFFGWVNYENTDDTRTGQIETAPAFALAGALGADYPLADNFSLYGELAFEGMTFIATEQSYTDDTETTHFESNSTASNEYPPPKFPGTNISIRVGVKLSFL